MRAVLVHNPGRGEQVAGQPLLPGEHFERGVGHAQVDGGADVRVGDAVTVFGAGLTADEQAKKADTVSYELLCAISPRVPRVYID